MRQVGQGLSGDLERQFGDGRINAGIMPDNVGLLFAQLPPYATRIAAPEPRRIFDGRDGCRAGAAFLSGDLGITTEPRAEARLDA